eukprot:TRINITY_DN215_c0_g2_i5.p1 TRINITY_DN215_c0_g2~~TRINITY_DN215_c0_g2_i5.p1  ORF type:complete len:512 (+),score=93.10 TRINITY_DN215_c0_g2_i5:214-1749(+)
MAHSPIVSSKSAKVNGVRSNGFSPHVNLAMVLPRASSLPNLSPGLNIGKLWIKAEGAFIDAKKHAQTKSGLEMCIDSKERVYSSIASGPTPTWREKMLIDVFDYVFTLRAMLFKINGDKKKKLAETEFSLDVRILTDGQLLAASFQKKRKLVASIKLFIQFKPQNYEYEKLENLVLTDPSILAAIFDTYAKVEEQKVQKVTSAIFSLFDYTDRLLDMMKHIITYEVDKVDDVALMLRDQTPTVQLLSTYIKSFGSLYLQKIEKAIVPFLLSDRTRVELDPVKIRPGEDISQMKVLLCQKAEFVMTTLFSLHSYIHPWIRELCKYMIRTVEKRFPERANIGLGAVLFLRYICPHLVSSPPQSPIGKIFTSDADFRRTLILITKLLQALSNNVEFGEKEPYMVCMNDFLLASRPKLAEFYSNILNGQSEPELVEELDRLNTSRKRIPDEVYIELHCYLHFNQKLLISRMEKYPPKDDQKERSEVVLAKILAELETSCSSTLESRSNPGSGDDT